MTHEPVWSLFPRQRVLAIPLAIVCTYLMTMYVLEARWRRLQRD